MVYTSGVDNLSHRFRQAGVVDHYYEFIDAQLAEVLEAAGPEANILLVSDHGFAYSSGHEPGSFAHDHAPDGVLILAGPAFASAPDGRIGFEAEPTIADIAPTALAVLGIPIARDLDGRVLTEALAQATLEAAPETVASYGRYAPRSAHARGASPPAPPEVGDGVMEKLRELGYVAE